MAETARGESSRRFRMKIERLQRPAGNAPPIRSEHIEEFTRNISKAEVDKIEDKIVEVNSVGIKKTIEVVCLNCEHKWEAPIEFNPVNFS